MPGALREIITAFGLDVDKGSFAAADSKVEVLRTGIRTLARAFAGGFVAQQIKNIVTQTAELGDNLDDTSQAIGVSTAALQELGHAASLSGVTQDTMERSLQQLARRSAEAARGTGLAKDTFAELGIQLRDSQGKMRPTEELVTDIANAMQGMTSDSDRVRVAAKLFGNEGARMVGMLRQGGPALEAMRQEARELGGVMGEDLIRASVDYTDTMTRFRMVLSGVRNTLASELIPAATKWLKLAIEWVRTNRELITDMTLRALRALGSMLSSLGQLFGFLASMAMRFMALLSPLEQSMVGLLAVMAAAVLIVGAKAAAFLFLLTVLEDVVGFFQGKKSVTGVIADWLKQLVHDLVTAPINAEDIWFVRVIQRAAKLFAEMWQHVQTLIGLGFSMSPSAIAERLKAMGGLAKTVASGPLALLGEGTRNVPGLMGLAGLTDAGTSAAPNLTTTIQQEINAAPGTDVDAVKKAAEAGAREGMDASYRHALRSLVPRVSEKL